jgi:His-Xaa-Ser repeat protein HxsA
MKKKFTKLAASIGIALTQTTNADDAIENDYFLSDIDTQLFKQPLNMDTPIFLAGHSSHASHGSHGSHRSSSGGAVKKPVKTYTPTITSTPTIQRSLSCPDSLWPYRKNTIREVQNLLIRLNYLDRSDVKTMGIMGYATRSALKSAKTQNNLPNTSGMMLDSKTLSAMSITCDD